MDHTLGVMKAYITRVGAGPFPSELLDETGEFLVAQGHEFGTTTGRKRRCGWFDAVLGRYTVQVNGLDGIALTKLDVLSPLAEIKICVAYRDTRSGELLHDLPASIHTLASVEPVYETLPGWQCSLEGITQRSQLPSEAQDYIQRIENLLETPVDMISTGPDRQETIVVNALLPTLASV
jgi:adenylosuccinate synthase